MFSSAGEFPAVYMTNNFIIAVYTGYLRKRTLFCMLGRIIGGARVEWQSENKIELDGNCTCPSVAATNEGVIILAYVKDGSQCHYVVGKREDNLVDWSCHSTAIDDGSHVSVGLHVGENSHTLTVMFAFVSAASRGYTRVGKLEPGQRIIDWDGDKREICNSTKFKKVSIAISPNQENMIAIAYQLGPMLLTKIHCQVGKLITSTANSRYIEFYPARDDGIKGWHPSVTINKDGYIMMAYQSFIGRNLKCHSGIVQRGHLSAEIIWKEAIADCFGEGCYPTVFLTDMQSLSGVFIELHGVNRGFSLHYCIGRLEVLRQAN